MISFQLIYSNIENLISFIMKKSRFFHIKEECYEQPDSFITLDKTELLSGGTLCVSCFLLKFKKLLTYESLNPLACIS